jgi:hypothetical protein
MKSYKNAVVECGDFSWRGKAQNLDDAIIGALAKHLPKNPSLLLRAKVAGHKAKEGGWHYIAFESALRIAGYGIRKTKEGFVVERP